MVDVKYYLMFSIFNDVHKGFSNLMAITKSSLACEKNPTLLEECLNYGNVIVFNRLIVRNVNNFHDFFGV